MCLFAKSDDFPCVLPCAFQTTFQTGPLPHVPNCRSMSAGRPHGRSILGQKPEPTVGRWLQRTPREKGRIRTFAFQPFPCDHIQLCRTFAPLVVGPRNQAPRSLSKLLFSNERCISVPVLPSGTLSSHAVLLGKTDDHSPCAVRFMPRCPHTPAKKNKKEGGPLSGPTFVAIGRRAGDCI